MVSEDVEDVEVGGCLPPNRVLESTAENLGGKGSSKRPPNMTFLLCLTRIINFLWSTNSNFSTASFSQCFLFFLFVLQYFLSFLLASLC